MTTAVLTNGTRSTQRGIELVRIVGRRHRKNKSTELRCIWKGPFGDWELWEPLNALPRQVLPVLTSNKSVDELPEIEDEQAYLSEDELPSSPPEDVLRVERILCYTEKDGVGRILIKWRNLPMKDSTWEPIENVLDEIGLIEEIEEAQELWTRMTGKTPSTKLLHDPPGDPHRRKRLRENSKAQNAEDGATPTAAEARPSKKSKCVSSETPVAASAPPPPMQTEPHSTRSDAVSGSLSNVSSVSAANSAPPNREPKKNDTQPQSSNVSISRLEPSPSSMRTTLEPSAPAEIEAISRVPSKPVTGAAVPVSLPASSSVACPPATPSNSVPDETKSVAMSKPVSLQLKNPLLTQKGPQAEEHRSMPPPIIQPMQLSPPFENPWHTASPSVSPYVTQRPDLVRPLIVSMPTAPPQPVVTNPHAPPVQMVPNPPSLSRHMYTLPSATPTPSSAPNASSTHSGRQGSQPPITASHSSQRGHREAPSTSGPPPMPVPSSAPDPPRNSGATQISSSRPSSSNKRNGSKADQTLPSKDRQKGVTDPVTKPAIAESRQVALKENFSKENIRTVREESDMIPAKPRVHVKGIPKRRVVVPNTTASAHRLVLTSDTPPHSQSSSSAVRKVVEESLSALSAPAVEDPTALMDSVLNQSRALMRSLMEDDEAVTRPSDPPPSKSTEVSSAVAHSHPVTSSSTPMTGADNQVTRSEGRREHSRPEVTPRNEKPLHSSRPSETQPSSHRSEKRSSTVDKQQEYAERIANIDRTTSKERSGQSDRNSQNYKSHQGAAHQSHVERIRAAALSRFEHSDRISSSDRYVIPPSEVSAAMGRRHDAHRVPENVSSQPLKAGDRSTSRTQESRREKGVKNSEPERTVARQNNESNAGPERPNKRSDRAESNLNVDRSRQTTDSQATASAPSSQKEQVHPPAETVIRPKAEPTAKDGERAPDTDKGQSRRDSNDDVIIISHVQPHSLGGSKVVGSASKGAAGDSSLTSMPSKPRNGGLPSHRSNPNRGGQSVRPKTTGTGPGLRLPRSTLFTIFRQKCVSLQAGYLKTFGAATGGGRCFCSEAFGDVHAYFIDCFRRLAPRCIPDGIRCSICNLSVHFPCAIKFLEWEYSDCGPKSGIRQVPDFLTRDFIEKFLARYQCTVCRLVQSDPFYEVEQVLEVKLLAPIHPQNFAKVEVNAKSPRQQTVLTLRLNRAELPSFKSGQRVLQLRSYRMRSDMTSYPKFPNDDVEISYSKAVGEEVERLHKPAAFRVRKDVNRKFPDTFIDGIGLQPQTVKVHAGFESAFDGPYLLAAVKTFSELSVDAIVKKVVEQATASKEDCIKFAIEFLQPILNASAEGGAHNDDDEDLVVIDSLTPLSMVKLTCPSTMVRIGIPARGHECKHIQCFDLQFFVQSQRNAIHQARWKCPVCRLYCRPHELVVDSWIQEILSQTSEHDKQIILSIEEPDDTLSWSLLPHENQQEQLKPTEADMCACD